MELGERTYQAAEYIETASGNKVCRKSVLCGSQNIVLNGKTIIHAECIVRGDLAACRSNRMFVGPILANSQDCHFKGFIILSCDPEFQLTLAHWIIKIGKNCVISERSVIRPPFKKHGKSISFYPLQIGDCVFIEEDVVLQSAQVGSYVHIGKGSVIGKRAKLGDCCAILPDSYVPPDTVVPTFAVYGGSPAKLVDELPETQQYLMNEYVMMSGGYKPEGPSEVYEEAKNLLIPGILKIDHFDGIDRLERVHSGAPNWRRVGTLAIYGSAQPTLEGLRQVVGHYASVGLKKVIWINMRTEPVVYVNNFSLAPRNPNNLKENIEINSLTVSDITELENFLVEDVIKKSVATGGSLTYFRDTYSLIPEDRKEEKLHEDSVPENVLTLKQGYARVLPELPIPLELVRLPINDVPNERVPDLADFDRLVELVRSRVDASTAVHCNCQMGRGRTTTGMFLVALISCKKLGKSLGSGEALSRSHQNGFYSLIEALLQQLPNADVYKAEVDSLMNDCEQLINLRGFIWHCKEAKEEELTKTQSDDAKIRRSAFWHNLAKNYVERYFYFICFNAYLTNPEGSTSFTDWCKSRNSMFVDILGRNAGSPEDISSRLLQQFQWC